MRRRRMRRKSLLVAALEMAEEFRKKHGQESHANLSLFFAVGSRVWRRRFWGANRLHTPERQHPKNATARVCDIKGTVSIFLCQRFQKRMSSSSSSSLIFSGRVSDIRTFDTVSETENNCVFDAGVPYEFCSCGTNLGAVYSYFFTAPILTRRKETVDEFRKRLNLRSCCIVGIICPPQRTISCIASTNRFDVHEHVGPLLAFLSCPSERTGASPSSSSLPSSSVTEKEREMAAASFYCDEDGMPPWPMPPLSI